MPKAAFKRLHLDQEVADLLRRVGQEENPVGWIAGYAVERSSNGATTVTVTLYADTEFSKAQTEAETKEIR